MDRKIDPRALVTEFAALYPPQIVPSAINWSAQYDFDICQRLVIHRFLPGDGPDSFSDRWFDRLFSLDGNEGRYAELCAAELERRQQEAARGSKDVDSGRLETVGELRKRDASQWVIDQGRAEDWLKTLPEDALLAAQATLDQVVEAARTPAIEPPIVVPETGVSWEERRRLLARERKRRQRASEAAAKSAAVLAKD